MVKTAASTRSFNIPVPAGGSPTRPGLFFEEIRLPSSLHHRKTAGWLPPSTALARSALPLQNFSFS
jgi:hypothetical protein